MSVTLAFVHVEPQVIVISGLPGVGKSTTARLLASRLQRAAHVEADRIHEMILSGAVWPDGEPDVPPEAARQLRLRLHNACCLARSFVEAGFTAVVDDIVIGSRLDDLFADLAGLQFGFVMLAPDFGVVYERWRQIKSPFTEVFGWIDEEIRLHTRRVGLWLDTSSFTPDQTVDAILSRLHEAQVRL